jgi:hypothetical protein
MDIFIDTNLVLHFRRVEELDWCGLAGVAPCFIVITPVLMRELERNKVHNPNAKLRQRAKDVISWLADRMKEDDPITLRDGVTLIFDDQEPLIDFAEHRLSREIADDHLIASALAWAQRMARDVAIASDDGGIALKLRSRPIRALAPDPGWRLPDAVDEERAKLSQMKRELARERNRRPALEVQFEGGGKKISVSPDSVDMPPSVEAMRIELPLMSFDEYMAADERREPGPRVYERTPVDRYNEELQGFFSDYEAFLLKHAVWAAAEDRTIELAFVLANTGSSPANNIDVMLAFPKHVEILAAEDAPDAPTEPDPPVKPHPNRRVATMGRAIALGPSYQPVHVPLEGEPQISRDKRHAEYFVRILKHDCAFELEPVLVRFAAQREMKPFEIEVSMTCNESDKRHEKLVVIPKLQQRTDEATAENP